MDDDDDEMEMIISLLRCALCTVLRSCEDREEMSASGFRLVWLGLG